MIKSRKSLHISMDPEVHANFKVQCVQRGLSMQEVFQAFAERVGVESNDMVRLLDQLAKDKRVKRIKKAYTKTDVDAIFSLLEEEDPLKDN